MKKGRNLKLTSAVLAVSLLVSSLSVYDIGYGKTQSDDSVMAELYVSPSGSAEGSGQKEDPLQTMAQAKDKVRTMNQNMTGDIKVYFEDGEYFMDHTVEFQPEDSGTNGHQIAYEAMEENHPVFTSGVEVTGWTDAQDPKRPGLVKTQLPNVENTRELYVDGKMATKAKGPFPGSIERFGDYESYTTYNGTHKAYKGYKSNAKEMLNWRNIQDIEFVYDILWVHRIAPVESIEVHNENEIYIKMLWEPFRLSQIAGGTQVHADLPSYIENAYELLDEPGEWYFDEVLKEMYYMPEEGQDMQQVKAVIPSLEQFLTVTGEADSKVQNISFDGLLFEYNTWLYPSTYGWPDQQANFAHDPMETENMHGYSVSPQAAIETRMSENIHFSRCRFQNIGSVAIGILKGSEGNVIEQCSFEDISGGGVLIGGVNINDAHPVTLPEQASLDEIKAAMEKHAEDPESKPHDERLIVKDNTVTNCYFNEIGTEYKGSIAVLAGYTDGTVITHNTIKNVAYSGISAGWGWGFWDQTGRTESVEAGEITPDWYPVFPEGDGAVSRNNIIEYNDVGHCMTKMHDGGGIYTLGDMPGSSISFNSIHDMSSWPGGLYLDEGSGGMEVEGNITYNTPYTCFYNIREFTWGHRMDQPDFKENYWDTAPNNINYPQELANQIGIEQQFEHIIPKTIESITAPDFVEAGDRIILKGNFGEAPGKILLSGPKNPQIDAQSKYLLSWEKGQIIFLVPGGVSSGAIYVEAADGSQTNKDKKLKVFGKEKVLFADDFEAYESGQLKAQKEAAEKYTFLHDKITITEEEGSKILKLSSNGPDTYLTKEADWEDVKITFDYRFDTDTKDYGGIYVSPRYQNQENRYLANMLPHWSRGILYQRYLNNGYSDHGDSSFTYEIGVWHTMKMEMTGDNLRVKTWKRGEEEPKEWTGNAVYGGLKDGGFFLQFADSTQGIEPSSSFDNLCISTFEEGVTVDLSEDTQGPVTKVTQTGEQIGDGSYINQVKIMLEAKDAGAGIAGIKWRLNGGKLTDYEEPILISKEGTYTLSYYAYDRVGNEEEVSEATGNVVGGKVIFEDSFDEYEAGAFKDTQEKGYSLTDPHQFEIIEEASQGGQVLKVQGKENTAVRMTTQDQWDGTIMTLDFLYQEQLSGIEGLYLSNYYQTHNPDNMHIYPVIPGYGGILLQQNVNGQANEAARLENGKLSLKHGTWYHMKAYTSSSQMAVKVWASDAEEPDSWMAMGKVSGLKGGGGLHLGFSAGSKTSNYALFDNLRIIGFEERQEAAEPADLTKLKEVYEEGCEKYIDTDYTQDTLANLHQALESAKLWLDQTALTKEDQPQIDEAVQAVKQAIINLELKQAEKSELEKKVQEMQKVDWSRYTEKSAVRLKKALDGAKKILDNQNLTIKDQKQIQDAIKELEAGFQELVKKPDTNPGEQPGVEVFYQVTFKNYDGRVLADQKIKKNGEGKAPSSPSRIGYQFIGWDKSYQNITQNLVITAQFKANSYKIRFHGNGGKGFMSAQGMTYDSSQKLKGVKFRKAGYRFTGWDTKKNGKGTSYGEQKSVKNLTSTNGNTITLYAQWKKVTAPGMVKTFSVKSQKSKSAGISIRNMKGADGYQIRYANNKSFKKANNVYVSASKGKKTVKTLSGLKKKMTYYIKVRAFARDSVGKRFYANHYSRVKTVKVKQ